MNETQKNAMHQDLENEKVFMQSAAVHPMISMGDQLEPRRRVIPRQKRGKRPKRRLRASHFSTSASSVCSRSACRYRLCVVGHHGNAPPRGDRGRLEAACCPTPLIGACTKSTTVHEAEASADCMIVSLTFRLYQRWVLLSKQMKRELEVKREK